MNRDLGTAILGGALVLSVGLGTLLYFEADKKGYQKGYDAGFSKGMEPGIAVGKICASMTGCNVGKHCWETYSHPSEKEKRHCRHCPAKQRKTENWEDVK